MMMNREAKERHSKKEQETNSLLGLKGVWALRRIRMGLRSSGKIRLMIDRHT